jgi:membrane protein
LVAVIEIPVLVVILAGVIAALYRFALGRPVGIRRLLPGAAASAVGLVLLAVGFGLYLGFSTHFTAVYGALAGAVIGMVAAYLAVYVVLLGAVLNARLLIWREETGLDV